MTWHFRNNSLSCMWLLTWRQVWWVLKREVVGWGALEGLDDHQRELVERTPSKPAWLPSAIENGSGQVEVARSTGSLEGIKAMGEVATLEGETAPGSGEADILSYKFLSSKLGGMRFGLYLLRERIIDVLFATSTAWSHFSRLSKQPKLFFQRDAIKF